MDKINQFHALLSDLASLLSEMTALENKKLDAIALNSIDSLEQYMKDEQAFAMKLKGLELKRQKVQAECGFGELSLKEIIKRSEGEDAERFSEAYALLEGRSREFKNVLSSANKYVELHLLGLEHMLTDSVRQKAEGGYDSKGVKKTGQGKTEFKSKKI